MCVTGLHNYGGVYLVVCTWWCVPGASVSEGTWRALSFAGCGRREDRRAEERWQVSASLQHTGTWNTMVSLIPLPLSLGPPQSPFSSLCHCQFLPNLPLCLCRHNLSPLPCLSLSLCDWFLWGGLLSLCQISWSNKIVSAIICYCWKVVFIFLSVIVYMLRCM